MDKTNLPNHIAIIMDGNGRWAKSNGLPRLEGHRSGVRTVRKITQASAELGIEHLTLFTFSSENWNRPLLEVNALMKLLTISIHKILYSILKKIMQLQK